MLMVNPIQYSDTVCKRWFSQAMTKNMVNKHCGWLILCIIMDLHNSLALWVADFMHYTQRNNNYLHVTYVKYESMTDNGGI